MMPPLHPNEVLNLMTPEEFEEFLTLWLKRQAPLDPWKQELRVPADFFPQVKWLCMRGAGTSLHEKGVVLRCPTNWSGWMGFRGYPLVLHQSHTFQIHPRSENTKSLLRGIPAQDPILVMKSAREPTTGEKRREEKEKEKIRKFWLKEDKKWAKKTPTFSQRSRWKMFRRTTDI